MTAAAYDGDAGGRHGDRPGGLPGREASVGHGDTTGGEQSSDLEHGPRRGASIVFLHGGNTASWMWRGQVQGLPDRHILTPDLPGYGTRAATDWPGLAAVADDVAATIRSRAIEGTAHVVGLSLGGHVALHLMQRHPELVRSCVVTGVAADGFSRLERALIPPQVPLWRHRWYWNLQSVLFRIPADERREFVDVAVAPSAATNRAMCDEIARGSMPRGPFAYRGPLLVVAGEREQRSVRDAFGLIARALPQAQTWIAPRMHHPWNAEDPELFTRMVQTFVDSGRWADAVPAR